MTRRKTLVLLLAGLIWIRPAQGEGDPISYSKFIIADGVKAGADLYVGALVETWGGKDVKSDEVVTWFKRPAPNPIEEPGLYAHANSTGTPTDTNNINGGTRDMVIRPTGEKIAYGAGTTPLYGPKSAKAEDATKGHVDSNEAIAKISVFSEATLDTKIRSRAGTVEKKTFKNAVTATIEGSAVAGTPKKGDANEDTYHSANSFAGIFLEGSRFFVKDVNVQGPFELAIKTQVFHQGIGARSDKASFPARLTDPIFMTVLDLDTGAETIDRVMTFDVEAAAADVVIDEHGILLAVDLEQPGSFARLAFDQPSSWVMDPYSYGARLDAAGLSLSGDTLPLLNWQISRSADRLEAFFAFGPDGQPFDMASVTPDGSLFTDGHTYRYSVGGTGAVVEVAAAVPEPSSLILMLIGIGALASMARPLGFEITLAPRWRGQRRVGFATFAAVVLVSVSPLRADPILAVDPLFQNDPKWTSVKLDSSNNTIGDYGCTLTAWTMLINYEIKQVGLKKNDQLISYTPDQINKLLNDYRYTDPKDKSLHDGWGVPLDDDGKPKGSNTDMNIGALRKAIEADTRSNSDSHAGLVMKDYSTDPKIDPQTGTHVDQNYKALKDAIGSGHPVVVRVNGQDELGNRVANGHSVLVIGIDGNLNWVIADPFNDPARKITLLSDPDYGNTIYGYSWGVFQRGGVSDPYQAPSPYYIDPADLFDPSVNPDLFGPAEFIPNKGKIDFAPVPEPASFTLVLLGVGTIAKFRNRRPSPRSC